MEKIVEIEITQNINAAYYQEYYSEWLAYRSKYRKWQCPIAYGLVVLSTVLLISHIIPDSIFVGLLTFSFFLILNYYFDKRKWLTARLNSKMNNQQFTLLFTDTDIQSIGPYVQASMQWNFFEEAIETKKGIILIPEKGSAIYLQKTIFGNKIDWQTILKKITNQKQKN